MNDIDGVNTPFSDTLNVMNGLKQRLDAFASLPLEELDQLSIENELRKLASI